jgi:hypothetical protein
MLFFGDKHCGKTVFSAKSPLSKLIRRLNTVQNKVLVDNRVGMKKGAAELLCLWTAIMMCR